MKKVLVAGGAGYIGSHTCLALKNHGYEPVVLDNLSEGHEWLVQFGPLEHGDIGDSEFVGEIIAKHGIKDILFFAAFTYVGVSVTNPEPYFENNVSKMHNFLAVCRRTGIKNFIFSSSCATYGNPITVPLTEDHPQNPVSTYGDTKLMGEKMLKWYGQAYGMKHVALRYFNACGASHIGTIGESHNIETHLIPIILKTLLGQRNHVSVFGTDYDTPDGTCIRDYIHVDDLANAHVKALEYLENGGESTQINLGTGTGYSVKEIINAVEQVTGHPVPVQFEERRAGDPPVLYANPQKSREVLGWIPTHSDLHNIIQSAWNWELKQSQTKV
jgi:UDP-glucose-4-epimerase GalE